MIDLAQRTVPAVVNRGAGSWPSKLAVVDDTTELTYAQLRALTARVAGGLRGLGVRSQDPVALLLANSVDHVLSWFALSWLNAIEVAVSTALRPDQVATIVNHSGAEIIVADEAYLAVLRAAAPQLTALRTVVVRGNLAAAAGLPFRLVSFDELRAATPAEAAYVAPQDVLGIVYTSGTTGQPKGIEVTQAQTYGRMWPGGPGGPGHDDRTLVVLPIYHVIGQCRGLYNTLIAGGTAVLAERFSASGFWSQTRRHRISFVPLVGTIVGHLLAQPERPDDRDHPVRHVALGTTSPLVERFRERFAVAEISMSYGLTEAGGVLVAPAEPTGCGYLRDDFEARLVDEDDIEVRPGEVGELVLRPREPWTVMRGYYRMPEATLQRFRNLWLHTEDLMYQRADGLFVFAGRRSDRIRIKGENVSVIEVEQVAAQYRQVAECAVTGVPPAEGQAAVGDDEILVAVVPRAGQDLDPAGLIEFLSARLPGYAVPRYVAVLSELPRTDATHRVRRQALAALPAADLWDRRAVLTPARDPASPAQPGRQLAGPSLRSSLMEALIIGGTGPTGPFIIQGLVDRGYTPVVLHRGSHEVDFVAQFEHVHADPHFADPVRDAIGGRHFDLVIAAYGRLRVLVDVLAGHTGRLITIGGTVYKRQQWSAPAGESAAREMSHKLVARVQQTEDAILARHEDGTFNLTHLRYPNLYGPRQLAPREWSVVRRILDGRRTVPVIDGGLTLESRAYVENAAQAVLLAADQPVISAGQTYHVADLVTPTDAERAVAIAAAMGAEIELVNYPRDAGLPGYFWGGGRNLEYMGQAGPPPTHHKLLDSQRIRTDLGFADLVPFEEAIRRTVEYYVANPLEYGGEEEARIGDPFDYQAEDAFAQALADFVRRCHSIPFAGVTLRHSYDHPKTVTQAASASRGPV